MKRFFLGLFKPSEITKAFEEAEKHIPAEVITQDWQEIYNDVDYHYKFEDLVEIGFEYYEFSNIVYWEYLLRISELINDGNQNRICLYKQNENKDSHEANTAAVEKLIKRKFPEIKWNKEIIDLWANQLFFSTLRNIDPIETKSSFISLFRTQLKTAPDYQRIKEMIAETQAWWVKHNYWEILKKNQ